MKAVKQIGNEQVAAFFASLDHPLKPVMEDIRRRILAVDNSITEQIKWKAPSFVHAGTDKITFNVHRNGKLLLIFHRGAKPKPLAKPGRLIEDPTGRLEWPADDRAVLTIGSAHELEQLGDAFEKLVRTWLAAAR
ncbi:MAG: DUF1801 domain-containing protein [Pyrinomonadaceae bacterium]|nr:DUF1801 domain-containing protein [Pyrinomonadaceae bacterium]